MGFCVAKVVKTGLSAWTSPIHRGLLLLHRFEQGRLGLRRGAVDLVGQQQVAEKRPGRKLKGCRVGAEDVRADDVGRHQIGGELDAVKLAADGQRQRRGPAAFSPFPEALPAARVRRPARPRRSGPATASRPTITLASSRRMASAVCVAASSSMIECLHKAMKLSGEGEKFLAAERPPPRRCGLAAKGRRCRGPTARARPGRAGHRPPPVPVPPAGRAGRGSSDRASRRPRRVAPASSSNRPAASANSRCCRRGRSVTSRGLPKRTAPAQSARTADEDRLAHGPAPRAGQHQLGDGHRGTSPAREKPRWYSSKVICPG